MTASTAPQGHPGDILNWPMLKISYLTEPERLAELLPPGLTPGSEPRVFLTLYNVPVLDEPEYGVVVSVAARHGGIDGEYTLGFGIDQEAAVFSSQERWGQPKYLASIRYFRLGDRVVASATHQGYTFLRFNGQIGEPMATEGELETNEWWIKSMRSVDMQPGSYDFPPHVVHVYSKYGTAHKVHVDGQLTLLDSPWDPIARYLPVVGEPSAHLWTPIFLDRRITLAGPLDPEAFWPHADTIGGSRWPGTNGGPRQD